MIPAARPPNRCRLRPSHSGPFLHECCDDAVDRLAVVLLFRGWCGGPVPMTYVFLKPAMLHTIHHLSSNRYCAFPTIPLQPFCNGSSPPISSFPVAIVVPLDLTRACLQRPSPNLHLQAAAIALSPPRWKNCLFVRAWLFHPGGGTVSPQDEARQRLLGSVFDVTLIKTSTPPNRLSQRARVPAHQVRL